MKYTKITNTKNLTHNELTAKAVRYLLVFAFTMNMKVKIVWDYYNFTKIILSQPNNIKNDYSEFFISRKSYYEIINSEEFEITREGDSVKLHLVTINPYKLIDLYHINQIWKGEKND